MGCKCHDIAKSAGSQVSKSLKHDSMTAEFCKRHLSKDLSQRLMDLRKQESIRKISNCVETEASAHSPF